MIWVWTASLLLAVVLYESLTRQALGEAVVFGWLLMMPVVREVMTPRPNIIAIEADGTLEQLRQLVINSS